MFDLWVKSKGRQQRLAHPQVIFRRNQVMTVTAFQKGLTGSVMEIYYRLDSGSKQVEDFVRNVVVPVSRVVWKAYLVPAYLVLEAVCNWLWDEQLVPTAIEVQADIDLYVEKCQKQEVVAGVSPEVAAMVAEVKQVTTSVFERALTMAAETKTELTDAELIRLAKQEPEQFPGARKWSYNRVLSQTVRDQLLILAGVVNSPTLS
jgi:hypothetical protein